MKPARYGMIEVSGTDRCYTYWIAFPGECGYVDGNRNYRSDAAARRAAKRFANRVGLRIKRLPD